MKLLLLAALVFVLLALSRPGTLPLLRGWLVSLKLGANLDDEYLDMVADNHGLSRERSGVPSDDR